MAATISRALISAAVLASTCAAASRALRRLGLPRGCRPCPWSALGGLGRPWPRRWPVPGRWAWAWPCPPSSRPSRHGASWGGVGGVAGVGASAALARSAALALSSAATFFMVAERPVPLAVAATARSLAVMPSGAAARASRALALAWSAAATALRVLLLVLFFAAMVFSESGVRTAAHRGGQARPARFPLLRPRGSSCNSTRAHQGVLQFSFGHGRLLGPGGQSRGGV
jgi:hypothetical protein